MRVCAGRGGEPDEEGRCLMTLVLGQRGKGFAVVLKVSINEQPENDRTPLHVCHLTGERLRVRVSRG